MKGCSLRAGLWQCCLGNKQRLRCPSKAVPTPLFPRSRVDAKFGEQGHKRYGHLTIQSSTNIFPCKNTQFRLGFHSNSVGFDKYPHLFT